MAYLYFVLICLFFGSNFILMDRATRWFGPVEVGFGRVASAAILLGLLWATLERRQQIRWRDVLPIAMVGLIANAFPYAMQPTLIALGMPHSFLGMTMAFVPLMTVLVSIPMLGIRPSIRQMIGIVMGFGFVVLLMFDGSLRGISIAMLAMAASIPMSYALGNTYIRRSLQDVDPTPLSVVMLITSTLALGPVVANSGLQDQLGIAPPVKREGFATAAMAMAWLGAVGTGFCTWAFVRMVQERGPLFAGMVTYVVPVIVMLWGILDNQTITTRQQVAIAGILSMVALVQAPAKQRADEPGAEPEPGEPAIEDWATEPATADA